jgi:membrane-bound serine protease (ClpP class)
MGAPSPGRRRLPLLAALLAVAWGAWAPAARAADRPLPGPFEKIWVIDFQGEIEGVLYAYVRRHVEDAVAAGADCIVLRVDSYGGTVFHSKKIADLLAGLPKSVHTVAWIPTKAISGAAMASISCREIIMAPGASIGDSQPIVSGSGGKPEPVGEKYESPLRTWFRQYAHANGYPEALVEAMVSARIDVLRVRIRGTQRTVYVRGKDFREASDDAELVDGYAKRDLQQVGPPVVREGELLTMTAHEALDFGFIRRAFPGGLPTDEATVLKALEAPGATVTYVSMSFSEEASKWLLQISGILSALVALAILLFVWRGPGVMTVIGGIALVLVIAINLTADQLHGFPIFLLVVGVGLLAVEVFLIPGFGLPGILGIATMSFALLLLGTGRRVDEVGTLEHGVVVDFALQFLLTALAAFVALLALSRWFPRLGPARRMILAPAGADGSPAAPLPTWSPAVGDVGCARSPLRPAGTAEFDGHLVDVTSEGGFVHPGARIRVLAVQGARVTVGEEEAPEA